MTLNFLAHLSLFLVFYLSGAFLLQMRHVKERTKTHWKIEGSFTVNTDLAFRHFANEIVEAAEER